MFVSFVLLRPPQHTEKYLSSVTTAENATNDRKERPSSADRRTESPYAPNNRDSIRDAQQQQQAANADGKPWNYPGLDLMTGAFWQNYSG